MKNINESLVAIMKREVKAIKCKENDSLYMISFDVDKAKRMIGMLNNFVDKYGNQLRYNKAFINAVEDCYDNHRTNLSQWNELISRWHASVLLSDLAKDAN